MMLNLSFRSTVRLLLAEKKPLFFLCFAFLGFYFSLFILLVSMQIYVDLSTWNRQDDLDGESHYIVNKTIDWLDTFKLRKQGFQPEEIDEISALDVVKKAVPFVSNDFNASLSIGGARFARYSVDLFFESIDPLMIDIPIDSKDWNWKEETSSFVPVLIPYTFFSLYNFGFAPSRGLPNLSENMAKKLDLHIRIGGRGSSENKVGRIVGFSKRINSLIVPVTFMEWANQKYGEVGSDKNPTRLMVRLDRSKEDSFFEFLKNNSWQSNHEGATRGRVYSFVLLAIFGAFVLGVLVAFLSSLVCLLTIRSFISSAGSNLRKLSLLGVPRARLTLWYFQLCFGCYGLACVLTGISFFIFRGRWIQFYKNFGLEVPFSWISPESTWGFFLFSLINLCIYIYYVNSQVKKAYV